MSRFKITREDMLRSKTVAPGWYLCKVTKVEDGQAKSDGSDITTVGFVIKDGPFAGVPLEKVLSAKAPSFGTPLIEAISGGKKVSDNGWDGDLDNAVGKDVKVFVKNEQYQGRLLNRAEDFKPAVG